MWNGYYEEAVTFSNPKGRRLTGILTRPSGKALNMTGVVLLNTGLNYRIGWHRLNVKLARTLCGKGYCVLRFDTAGIGDSEGEIPEGNVIDHFVAIEKGSQSGDVRSAINFFLQKTMAQEVVLAGLCGGAVSAMLTAVDDKRVSGIIHIAGPVTLSAEEGDSRRHPWEVKELLSLYMRKLLNPGGWWRMLTGKSDYRTIVKTLKEALPAAQAPAAAAAPGNKSDPKVRPEAWLRLNNSFIQAFKKYMASGRRILFIFAERDSATWEFETMFREQYIPRKGKNGEACAIHVVKNTNHIFATEKSQAVLKDLICSWLN